MKSGFVILATIAVAASFIAAPAHLHGEQAADVQQHDQHHPDTVAPQPSPKPAPPSPQSGTMGNRANMSSMMSRMRANDAKLDQLVKTMQTAQGAAKTDAIAALLTALVEDRKNCGAMMANMMSMMNMGAGQTPGAPATPKK